MKVGDYIKTDDGLIGKVVSEPYEYKNSNSIGCDIDFGNNDVFNECEMCQRIIKSSSNIIDLIEVGDIVNYGLLGGGMVIFKKDGEITTNTILFSSLKEKDIKKIITKEQIENMEYEVGE